MTLHLPSAAPPPAPNGPNCNHLLAALPEEDYARLSGDLEHVHLPLGEMLYAPGQTLQHAYFPTTAVASLHYVTESGQSAETACVGNEGMVGISLFLGGLSTPGSAVVPIAGEAYRLDRRLLLAAFQRGELLQRLLLRYAQALITQISQTAACNRHHAVDQQLSRWLLLTMDRTPGRDLVMTQELLASMLGVRRESVTAAAGSLQQGGYIRYRRGHIAVVDRGGLQTRACECYAVVRRETSRLLSDVQYRQQETTTAV